MALRALLLAVAISGAMATGVVRAQDTTREATKKDAKKKPKVPRVKPMPSPEQVVERRQDAESLPLFAAADPLPFTLIANFKAVFKDRDTLSARRFPARLIVANAAGTSDTIPVQLATRGHYRLAKCAFSPLRVVFPKKETKGTPFERQKDLKLGTHCARDDMMEQYVLREYLAYRIHAIVTPLAFRVRLAKGTYVDSASGKPLDTRYAIFVENEDHMAARAGGVLQELRGAMFTEVDQDALLNMTLFEYMIGNSDWSMYWLHNVRMVETPEGHVIPVPYDFDFSGLVGTRYSTPDPHLPIKSVKERLFRGPCKTAAEWAPTLAQFRNSKAQVMALYDGLPDMDKGYAKDAKDYMMEFYRMLDRPDDVNGELIDNCNRKGAA